MCDTSNSSPFEALRQLGEAVSRRLRMSQRLGQEISRRAATFQQAMASLTEPPRIRDVSTAVHELRPRRGSKAKTKPPREAVN